jgi:hypothetical protein
MFKIFNTARSNRKEVFKRIGEKISVINVRYLLISSAVNLTVIAC